MTWDRDDCNSRIIPGRALTGNGVLNSNLIGPAIPAQYLPAAFGANVPTAKVAYPYYVTVHNVSAGASGVTICAGHGAPGGRVNDRTLWVWNLAAACLLYTSPSPRDRS